VSSASARGAIVRAFEKAPASLDGIYNLPCRRRLLEVVGAGGDEAGTGEGGGRGAAVVVGDLEGFEVLVMLAG